MEQVVSFVLSVALVYILSGVLFAFVFLWKGITKLDEGAKGTGFLFKLLVMPGVIIFWPLLLYKWLTLKNKI